MNWRVLDKTQDGKVRLISAKATAATVKFEGSNGYNNIVYLLDELCNKLYGSEHAVVQNLKIEDIQNKMNLSVWNYNNSTDYGKTFDPQFKTYPLIFAQEKGQTVNGSTGTLGMSEQTSLISGDKTANNWTVKYTKWTKNMAINNYIDAIYYELFHTVNSYYLSSRCVYAFYGAADYQLRYVSSNNVTSTNNFRSSQRCNWITY